MGSAPAAAPSSPESTDRVSASVPIPSPFVDRASANPPVTAQGRASSVPPRPSTAPVADDATRILQLQALLGQAKQAMTSKDNELRAAIAQRDLLRTQVSGREARIRELEKTSVREIELRQRTAELERQLGELERQLADAKPLRSKLTELEAIARENTAFKAKITELQAKVAELEPAAKEAESLQWRVAELESDNGEKVALRKRLYELEPLAAENESLKRRLLELEARPAQHAEADDDLQQIRGIGPAYARSLKALGIRSFAQIAAWTDEDITAMAQALKTRPDRIRRDGWIDRAKELLQAKS
jgi:predicted flap endonuclease-1-like 5' DNA nuclease